MSHRAPEASPPAARAPERALADAAPSIGALLRDLGLSPRKALGQHFLVSPGVLVRILDAADIAPGDAVVEVGPGLGVLTRGLLDRGARVTAVELDDEFAAALARSFAGHDRVRIVHADARTVDIDALAPPGEAYLVVANLPYYAATPIVRRFLEAGRAPRRLVVTVQREVARSMTAKPGGLGLLGLGVQFYGAPRIVAAIRPGAFYPPPKVTSAVVRIDLHAEPLLPASQRESFFALARAAFSAPRKQLRGGLSHTLGRPPDAVADLLRRGGVDPVRRPATLSLDEWAALYGVFSDAGWLP